MYTRKVLGVHACQVSGYDLGLDSSAICRLIHSLRCNMRDFRIPLI
ncbi:hypothetical protein RchiOBHm_Chr3g0480021 [Rosa chinensis]|uniref:Uncharacterized protein n=1 Tax=Rosa chinensis TaxID=74649 RepID=A0A2P6RDL8_ROSCH|nr:hypothetical protein RchiOBHm_Chr3g0480021 [Rosa chinensis]